MVAFLVALVFEILTAWLFFRRIVTDTSDGDIGLGILFWLMVALYVLADGAWAGILIWEHFWKQG
jgi:predicted permease